MICSGWLEGFEGRLVKVCAAMGTGSAPCWALQCLGWRGAEDAKQMLPVLLAVEKAKLGRFCLFRTEVPQVWVSLHPHSGLPISSHPSAPAFPESFWSKQDPTLISRKGPRGAN